MRKGSIQNPTRSSDSVCKPCSDLLVFIQDSTKNPFHTQQPPIDYYTAVWLNWLALDAADDQAVCVDTLSCVHAHVHGPTRKLGCDLANQLTSQIKPDAHMQSTVARLPRTTSNPTSSTFYISLGSPHFQLSDLLVEEKNLEINGKLLPAIFVHGVGG